MLELLVSALAGFFVALAVGFLVWGRALTAARATVSDEQQKRAASATEVLMQQGRIAELGTAEAERARLAEELAGLKSTLAARETAFAEEVARTTQRFEALASKALEGAQTQFLERAQARFTEHATTSEASLKQLLQPVSDTLKKYETRLGEVEAVRAESYGQLKQQLENVVRGQALVSGAAAKLETALRSSGKVAGRWGEEQCRNVLEAAGLVEGIDFETQFSVDSEDGNRQRPDFKLMLPGDRALIIDVKCSIDSYVSAAEADDPEARGTYLKAHARAVRTHAEGLAKKDYAKAVGNAVEFVVLFVPGENFLGAALEQDRALMNDFFKRQVVLAGPVNLVAVARTVAALRDQARLAKEAAEIARLGKELYDSIRLMGGNFLAVQKSLESTVGNWNKLISQADNRVVSRARRFRDLGAATGLPDLPELPRIDITPGLPSTPEMKTLPDASTTDDAA